MLSVEGLKLGVSGFRVPGSRFEVWGLGLPAVVDVCEEGRDVERHRRRALLCHATTLEPVDCLRANKRTQLTALKSKALLAPPLACPRPRRLRISVCGFIVEGLGVRD